MSTDKNVQKRLLHAQREQRDRLKLHNPKLLVKEGIDQIDRGEFEIVLPGGLDDFMAKVDARVRAAKP